MRTIKFYKTPKTMPNGRKVYGSIDYLTPPKASWKKVRPNLLSINRGKVNQYINTNNGNTKYSKFGVK